MTCFSVLWCCRPIKLLVDGCNHRNTVLVYSINQKKASRSSYSDVTNWTFYITCICYSVCNDLNQDLKHKGFNRKTKSTIPLACLVFTNFQKVRCILTFLRVVHLLPPVLLFSVALWTVPVNGKHGYEFKWLVWKIEMV